MLFQLNISFNRTSKFSVVSFERKRHALPHSHRTASCFCRSYGVRANVQREGTLGRLYSVTANVVATQVEKSKAHTLGSVTFTGKGLAQSEEEVLGKAASNVKIGQNDISDLFGKALQN